MLVAAAVGVAAEDAPTTDQIRNAAQQSIPYIQDNGASWIRGRKCVSCHRVSMMVWSLTAARRKGLAVSDKLDEWLKWATDISLSKNKQGKVVGLGNKEGVAQILVGLAGSPRDGKQTAGREKLVALLRDGQQANGAWKPGGQLPSQKRPLSETATVSTMWLTLALLDDDATAQTTPIITKARRYIEQSPPGKSTEWYALRLLLAVRKADRQARDRFVNELRKQQQPDGGWGWIVGEPSDALGTGLALYALARAGLPHEDATVQRAAQFLVSTQRDDGAWAVHGTKTNKQDDVQESAVYWGTTWAAVALMSVLPEPR